MMAIRLGLTLARKSSSSPRNDVIGIARGARIMGSSEPQLMAKTPITKMISCRRPALSTAV